MTPHAREFPVISYQFKVQCVPRFLNWQLRNWELLDRLQLWTGNWELV